MIEDIDPDVNAGAGEDLPDVSRYEWDDARPDFWGARAWTKACVRCALKPDDPQGLGEATLSSLRTEIETGSIDFYCAHRETKAGMHRICACAAALEKGVGGKEQ